MVVSGAGSDGSVPQTPLSTPINSTKAYLVLISGTFLVSAIVHAALLPPQLLVVGVVGVVGVVAVFALLDAQALAERLGLLGHWVVDVGGVR